MSNIEEINLNLMKIAVMTAYEKGAEIEVQKGDRWFTCRPPSWNWAYFNYRVKQEMDDDGR